MMTGVLAPTPRSRYRVFPCLCRRRKSSYLNRSDVLGGSALGNISNAHVSLHTVDIGVVQLAMHSHFETGGVRDTNYLLTTLRSLYLARLGCKKADS